MALPTDEVSVSESFTAAGDMVDAIMVAAEARHLTDRQTMISTAIALGCMIGTESTIDARATAMEMLFGVIARTVETAAGADDEAP